MTPAHGDAVASPCAFRALAALDQTALDALPQAVYLCAGDGRLMRFNQRAAQLWGRTPALGDPGEWFCGSFRLYGMDGALLPHDACPMATALHTGQSFRDQEVVIEQPSGDRLTVLVNIAAFKDESGRVNGAVNCFEDISARKQAEAGQALLIEELNHRIKNILATVHSIAASTARNTTSVADFTSAFEPRLVALSRAHTFFAAGHKSAPLRSLLAQQLEPFGGAESKFRFEGPDIDLSPQAALALSLAFHELATNAAKYGALANPSGRIEVMWSLGADPDHGLELDWKEMDGPPLEPPKRRGFGTRLIERTISAQLDGRVDMRFASTGLQVRAWIPLTQKSDDAPATV